MKAPKLGMIALSTLGLSVLGCGDEIIEGTSNAGSETNGDGDGDPAGDGDGDPVGDGDPSGDGDGDPVGDGDGDPVGDGDGDPVGDGDGDPSGDGDGDPTGDGDGDPVNEPIQLISGEYDGNSGELTLVFSEAVADVSGLDPTQFRISAALSYLYQGMPYSGYWDVNYLPYYYSGNGPQSFVTTSVANGNAPEEVVLGFNEMMRQDVCDALDMIVQQAPMQNTAFLFPHYDPGQTPLMSEDGDELAPIGADWVLSPGETYIYVDGFDFPNLDPQVPIPCTP